MMWEVLFTKSAEKDKKLLKRAGLDKKTKKLLDVLRTNPFQNPPAYEKPVGDLDEYYSRRIDVQHRLVYRVMENSHHVIVHAMWTHYGDRFVRTPLAPPFEIIRVPVWYSFLFKQQS